MLTPHVVYLRWADIDTKVLGTLLPGVADIYLFNFLHLVIELKHYQN